MPPYQFRFPKKKFKESPRRLRKRAKPTDPGVWEQFLWKDRRELERGMESLIKTKRFRKFVIKNTGTFSSLKTKITKILEEIKADE